MRNREATRPTVAENQPLPQTEILAELVEDFSEYAGERLRVLPARSEQRIDWYDPAGFLLARSRIPENWDNLESGQVEFMLTPASVSVAWQRYI